MDFEREGFVVRGKATKTGKQEKKRTKKIDTTSEINTLYDNQGTLSNDNLGRIFEHSGRGFRSHWV